MSTTPCRTTRVTAVTPTGEVDLTLTETATAADLLHWACSASRADPSGLPWEVVHPTRGIVPVDVPLTACGLREGDTVVLRPAVQDSLSEPVDDVAAAVRDTTGAGRADAVGAALALTAVLVPAGGALAMRHGHADAAAPGLAAAVIGAVVPHVWTSDTDSAAVAVAGMCSAGLGAVLATLALAPAWGPAGAAWVGFAVATALGWGAVRAGARVVSSLPVVAAAIWAVMTVHVAVRALGGGQAAPQRAWTVTGGAALLLAACAGAVAVRVSGLGALDDRVALGERVSQDQVTGCVDRAVRDLAGILVVSGVAWVVSVQGLLRSGAAGIVFCVLGSLAIAGSARRYVRGVHVAPCIVAGAAGIASVIVDAGVQQQQAAVPALLIALSVLLVMGAAAAAREVDPVLLSRVRRWVDVVTIVCVVLVPAAAAGVLGLYGRLGLGH